MSQSDAVWIGPILFLAAFCKTHDPKWIAGIAVGFVLGLTNPVLKDWFVRNFPNVKAFKRPEGAMNCELDNSGGDQSGEPGFPSGHMTTVAFYFALLYFYAPGLLKDQRLNNLALGGLAILSFGWMAYARRFCHTILQRIAGTALGIGAAYFTSMIM